MIGELHFDVTINLSVNKDYTHITIRNGKFWIVNCMTLELRDAIAQLKPGKYRLVMHMIQTEFDAFCTGYEFKGGYTNE